MKKLSIAIGILGLIGSAAFSQSPPEQELLNKLKKGPDSAKALETVLKAPDKYSPIVLFFGAGAAFREERLEDSAFLLYAAQLRARFDKECFPPKGTGGDSPFLVIGILSNAIGGAVNPAVMAKPKEFDQAIARLKKWTPKAPKDYHPGYEFTERKAEEEAHKAVKP